MLEFCILTPFICISQNWIYKPVSSLYASFTMPQGSEVFFGVSGGIMKSADTLDEIDWLIEEPGMDYVYYNHGNMVNSGNLPPFAITTSMRITWYNEDNSVDTTRINFKYPDKVINSVIVNSVYFSKHTKMYICTNRGLFECEKSEFYPSRKEIEVDYMDVRGYYGQGDFYSLYEFQKSQIIVCDDGVFRLKPKYKLFSSKNKDNNKEKSEKEFTKYKIKRLNRAKSTITSAIVIPSNQEKSEYLLCAMGGLIEFSNKKWRPVKKLPCCDYPFLDKVFDMKKINQYIWIISRNSGLSRYNLTTGAFHSDKSILNLTDEPYKLLTLGDTLFLSHSKGVERIDCELMDENAHCAPLGHLFNLFVLDSTPSMYYYEPKRWIELEKIRNEIILSDTLVPRIELNYPKGVIGAYRVKNQSGYFHEFKPLDVNRLSTLDKAIEKALTLLEKKWNDYESFKMYIITDGTENFKIKPETLHLIERWIEHCRLSIYLKVIDTEVLRKRYNKMHDDNDGHIRALKKAGVKEYGKEE